MTPAPIWLALPQLCITNLALSACSVSLPTTHRSTTTMTDIQHPQELTLTSTTPMAFNPETLISKAIDAGTPIEALEKLLGMRKELQAEMARTAFFDALAEFQASCPPVLKQQSAGAGAFAYRYADLATIQQTIMPTLTRCGLSVTFDTEVIDGGVLATCYVHHRLGHQQATKFYVPPDPQQKMNAAQRMGSISSYAKRYAIGAALALVIDHDDDCQTPKPAAAPAPRPAAAPPRQPPAPAAPAMASAKQLALLFARSKELGISPEQIKTEMLQRFNVESSKALTAKQASTLIDLLPDMATPAPASTITPELLQALKASGWVPGGTADDLDAALMKLRESAANWKSIAAMADSAQARMADEAEARRLQALVQLGESSCIELMAIV
ncbi:MAG: ERF family protein [Gammaproteobacteria bacterium]|nr:ERF family protein [Gammaproteobacteria bacterium]